VLAQALDVAAAERQPERASGRFDPAGEIHVVDHLAADRVEAAGALECLAPDEHAATGRRTTPPHRVEDVEEEHERRDEQPFPAGAAVKAGEAAVQSKAVRLGLGDEACDRARRVPDVRVGQQQVIRQACRADALLERPDLADPAWR
jgi:hypothetical protein